MIKVQFRHLDVPTWIHDHEHGTRFVYTNNRAELQNADFILRNPRI